MIQPVPESAAPEASKRKPARSRFWRFFDRVLFPRHAPLNLAFMRVCLGAYCIWYLWQSKTSIIRTCTETAQVYYRPVGVASFLSGPISSELFTSLYSACSVAAVFFTAGFLFRFAAPIFSLLLLFILTYRQSWGFIYHTENLVAVAALVLSFAPSAQVLSVDRDLAGNRPLLRRVLALEESPRPSWHYGWPVKLIILITGIAYWVAGMAKLGWAGFAWVHEAHLLDHIGNNALRYHFFKGGAGEFTYTAYSWPSWVWPWLGGFSLLLELGAPLAVLHEGLGLLFAVGLFSFHWGVYYMMNIPFPYQMYGFAYVYFVRWDKLLRWGARACERYFPQLARDAS